MQTFFYRDNSGTEIGPVDLNTLAQLRFAGVLNDETLVRSADSEKWTPCSAVVSASPASPPAPPATSGKGKGPISPVLVMLILAGALVYGGMTLYKSIAAKSSLTYDFSVDGKQLAGGQVPVVTVDGQVFDSGGHLKPGRHQISVRLENVEPYERRFWLLYGTKNLGNLPLESSKGSLSVSVSPSPATITVQRGSETVSQGDAPLKVEKLPVGDYLLVIRRGKYEETHSATILRRQETATNVVLDLGIAELSSEPADAEFALSGNGHHWEGKLPMRIEDVPVGNYSLAVTRKGWERVADIPITRGSTMTNKTEFPYGSIKVTSEPTGLAVSTNGVEIGKTPLTIQELKPGQYTVTVSDGENDLITDLSIRPKEHAEHAFVFRYGMVQLASTPSGATVVRKGKEAGRTPLTLNHVPAGVSSVGLVLNGYVATNLIISAIENAVTNYSVKLISEQYLKAMDQAREALASGQLGDAKTNVAKALVTDPDDAAAISLQAKIGEAEQAAEKARLQAEQQEASEKRQANERKFQQLIASSRDASLFPVFKRTYTAPLNKVWNSAIYVLVQQKEQSVQRDTEAGIITTSPTQHSALLFLSLHANQYLILVEQNDDNTTTVKLDLVAYYADYNNGNSLWRPIPSGSGGPLEQMANDYFDKIERALNPPVKAQ